MMNREQMADMVRDENGDEVRFSSVVPFMDDEIRERLHEELSPCSNQTFFDAYLEAHLEKYGEDFAW